VGNVVRKKFVAGNWKMFTNTATARALAASVAQGLGDETRVRVAVCPPAPYLALVGEVLAGSPIALGGQNCASEKEGALTGEISPVMLLDVGCTYVILGHSERRHKLGETDAMIAAKVHAALGVGLQVILCVGETLEERQAQRYEPVLRTQLIEPLEHLRKAGDTLGSLCIAYEPVWAIGTGHNATPEQAQQAHAFIRQHIADTFGSATASALPILYGGSVKPENAASLLQQPDVDGGLIGGASLQADSFLAIVRAALPG
jgi:triosephosphate isomerase